MNTIEDTRLAKHLLAIKNRMNEEDLMQWGAFLTERHVASYCNNLRSENRDLFIEKHEIPYFEEEDPTAHIEIWEAHSNFLSQLESSNSGSIPNLLLAFLKSRPISEFLVILGQRFTPASILNFEALPPSFNTLMEQAFIPHNSEIKVAVRAWEKHVGRSADSFWGTISGKPVEREAHVKALITRLMENHYWWNVFGHYKHGTIYEVRESGGHGLRWSIDNKKFIGFVEPFITE